MQHVRGVEIFTRVGIGIGVVVALGFDGDDLNPEIRRPIITSNADTDSDPDSDPDADASRLLSGRLGATKIDTTKSC